MTDIENTRPLISETKKRQELRNLLMEGARSSSGKFAEQDYFENFASAFPGLTSLRHFIDHETTYS